MMLDFRNAVILVLSRMNSAPSTPPMTPMNANGTISNQYQGLS